jgi:hypothetical protein
LEEAQRHQVHTLVMPILNDNKFNLFQDNEELLYKWRSIANASITIQTQNYHVISNLLECFEAENIAVIAVKGLVLRDLYLHPELRIMGDIDLLVKQKDIRKSKKLLIDSGYRLFETSSKHFQFVLQNQLPIELHKQLLDHRFFQNAKHFENAIWENLHAHKIGSAGIYVLSPLNELLYLCFHSAIHMMLDGFGLRQLCDIVLFVEFHQKEIDWDLFQRKLNFYEIEGFAKALFILCEKILDFKSPFKIEYDNKDEKYIEMLIQYIFSGGVFGNYEMNQRIANKLSRYSDFNGMDKTPGKFVSKLSFLFPASRKMDTTYNYARKYPILLPIAWMHRIIINIFRKDFSLEDKVKFLYTDIKSNESSKRAQLLYWMNLYK